MQGQLTNESIRDAVDELEKELRDKQFGKYEIRKNTLLLEEILMTYRDEAGEDTVFELELRKFLGLYSIVLKVRCQEFDYRENLDQGNLLTQFTKTMRVDAIWSYRRKCNNVAIILRKKHKVPQLVWILAGAVMAYALCKACLTMPDNYSDLIEVVLTDQMTPAVYSVLRLIAGALIFFSISTSIGALGSVDAFRKLIASTITRIAANNIFMIGMFSLVFMLIFGVAEGSGNFNIEAFLDLIFDMIPPDLWTPFIDGNMFQITILAIAMGILIISVDNNIILMDLFECFRVISIIAMQAFCRILPFVVFLNVFIVFNAVEGINIAKVMVVIGIGIAVAVVIALIETAELSIHKKIGFAEFINTMFKGTMVASVTASSSAALSDTRSGLIRLGVEDTFVDLMLPLEQAFYKPFVIVITYTGVFSVMRTFDLTITTGELVTLAVITLIIVVACPPVPGGMISCLTILESQMMFPDGSMGILILIATLMDYVGTGLSIYSIGAEITGQACRKGKVNKDRD